MESTRIGEFLKESRVPGSPGNIAKKITVKLYGKGVFAKQENRPGSENTMYYSRRAGQFIYSKLDFLNGAFGIIPENLDGFETTIDLPCFDFVGDRVAPDWFLQYVSRPDFYAYQGGLGNGGRKARRISPDDFLELEIDLPPLPEQKKIAEILSGIDRTIKWKNLRVAKLSLHKTGLSNELIYGKSAMDSFVSGVISEIAEVNPKTVVNLPGYSQVSFIAMQDTSETGEVTRTQVRTLNEVFKGYSRFENDDILVAKITPCFENGKGGLTENLLNGIGFGSTEFHVLRAIEDKADSKFIHHITQSERFRKKGEGSMTGSAGQKRIPADFIKLFPVNIPSLSDQRKIASILTSIDMAIKKQMIEVNTLANLKSSLASDLLSGRKRVSV